MIDILTIDADYWYPLEQGVHCGRCPEFRDEPCDRTDEVWLCDHRKSTEDERAFPAIGEIVKRVRRGTPIKVSESHAEMHRLLRRVNSVTHQPVRVVNIDEHSDCGFYDFSTGDKINCGNWVTAACINHILRYYRLIDGEEKFRRWRRVWEIYTPDMVHVCHSGPYLSTKGDQHFVDLVLALERKAQRRAHVFGHDHRELKAMIDARRQGWKRQSHQLKVLEQDTRDTLQVIYDPGADRVNHVITGHWSIP